MTNQEKRQAIIKALNHTARIKAIKQFSKTETVQVKVKGKVVEKQVAIPASPKELAKVMELPLPNVSYHVKILRELDLIELKRTTPRRGAVEHHYVLNEKMRPICEAAIVLLG